MRVSFVLLSLLFIMRFFLVMVLGTENYGYYCRTDTSTRWFGNRILLCHYASIYSGEFSQAATLWIFHILVRDWMQCWHSSLGRFATGFIYRGFSTGVSWRLMFAMGCILPLLVLGHDCTDPCTIMVEYPRRWLVQKKQYYRGGLLSLCAGECSGGQFGTHTLHRPMFLMSVGRGHHSFPLDDCLFGAGQFGRYNQ
jgi:hypothetical protein